VVKLAAFWQETRGALAPIFAVLILALLGVVPLVVDLGRVYLVKSELQRAADVGALAGALGFLSLTPGGRGLRPITPDASQALSTSQAIVAANQADGASLQLLSSDFYYGKWDLSTSSFTPLDASQLTQINALKVVVRKDQLANGPVPLYFAGLFSPEYNSIDLTAQAVALMGYAGYAPPGAGALPLAIDENRVGRDAPGDVVRIYLSASAGDGGTWFATGGLSGASDLRGWINGSIPSPALRVGDQMQIMSGVADSVLQELERVVNNSGGSMDGLLGVVPSGALSGSVPLLGFVAFHITGVQSQGTDKYVEGYTVPNYVAPQVAPGGPNYGLMAGMPKLVK
jgi:hypothetical protein